jgi:hypothetical protein
MRLDIEYRQIGHQSLNPWQLKLLFEYDQHDHQCLLCDEPNQREQHHQ